MRASKSHYLAVPIRWTWNTLCSAYSIPTTNLPPTVPTYKYLQLHNGSVALRQTFRISYVIYWICVNLWFCRTIFVFFYYVGKFFFFLFRWTVFFRQSVVNIYIWNVLYWSFTFAKGKTFIFMILVLLVKRSGFV